MKNSFLGCALLALSFSSAAAKGEFTAASAAAQAVPIAGEPATYEKAFTDGQTELTADARCSRIVPRQIDVDVRWDVKREGVTSYRVDITEFSDGFPKGRYLTSGERPVEVKSLPFEDAQPGIYYYWRVLAKTTNGWVVAGAGRFDAPICAVDDTEGER